MYVNVGSTVGRDLPYLKISSSFDYASNGTSISVVVVTIAQGIQTWVGQTTSHKTRSVPMPRNRKMSTSACTSL